jgi:EmrB/QacA subfamily drug resistance transporter
MSKVRSRYYITTLVAAALFMEMLDGTIIATALPQMAKSFNVGAVHLNIGMTAYMLALAVFIPISGWVADRFGSRSVFAAAIGVFTVASLFCGLAHTLTEFTLMRVVQGLGGAMMFPVGRLIVLRDTPKEDLTETIAYMTWPALTALVVGPPLGGFITTYFSWHWIFFLNLPLGAVALTLTLLWVENLRSDERHPFDWLTFLFAGVASTGLVYGLESLGGAAMATSSALLILALSVMSGVIAVFAARRSSYPFIDLESMRLKSYALSIYGASGFRVAVAVLPFLLPLMFQISFGMTAFQSGLYLLALFAGDLSMKGFVIQVLRRFGFRRILIVNGVITAASVAFCAVISPGTPPLLILGILYFHGATRSLEFTCMTTLAYTEIPSERMGQANGFLSAVMQLSMGVGVAVGAVTIRLVAHAHGHEAAAPRLNDFHVAILCMSLLTLAPVFDSLGLSADAGAATSRHLVIHNEVEADLV